MQHLLGFQDVGQPESMQASSAGGEVLSSCKFSCQVVNLVVML